MISARERWRPLGGTCRGWAAGDVGCPRSGSRPPAHTDQPACPQRIPGSGGGCRTLGSYRGGRFGRPSPRRLKKVSTRAEARGGAESGGGGGAALAAAAAGSGAVAAPSSSEKTSSSSPRVRRSATSQLRMAASTSPKARGRSRRSGRPCRRRSVSASSPISFGLLAARSLAKLARALRMASRSTSAAVPGSPGSPPIDKAGAPAGRSIRRCRSRSRASLR